MKLSRGLSKKICLYFIATFSSAFIGKPMLWACMPHSPDDVFIARYQSSMPTLDQNNVKQYQLKLQHPQFVFRSYLDWFKYSRPRQWQSNFKLNHFKHGDLVIGIGYAPDQASAMNYQLTALARLNCQNDTISFGRQTNRFVFWDRNNGQCRTFNIASDGLLDGFLTHDQSYYLQKLKSRYPSCKVLNSAFPKIKN